MLDYQMPQRKPDCARCCALHADLVATQAEFAAYKSNAQQTITALQSRVTAAESGMCRGYDTDRTHNQH